jgi:hypothetical protein
MKTMMPSTMLATCKRNHWHETRDQEDGGENGRGRGEELDVGGCRGSEYPACDEGPKTGPPVGGKASLSSECRELTTLLL